MNWPSPVFGRFQNGCNKVVIEPRVVQFWSEIILLISNRTRAARSFNFGITRMISAQIALHSVQLPLFISTTSSVVFITARITDIRFFYHNAYIWFKFIYNHMRQCWHSIGLSLTFSFIWRTLIITRKNITRVCCIWSVLAFYLLEVFNM